MFLHRDHSLNLNEVNYVSVTALHVNALFIAGYKRSLPPGFLGRGNENASLKISVVKRNLLDEFLHQDYRLKHMARSTETLFKTGFAISFSVSRLDLKKV